MDERMIMGVFLRNRLAEAGEVQDVFTRYGCSIKTRIGLHDTGSESCSASGLIILELRGEASEKEKLEKELTGIEGVEVGKMTFKTGPA